MTNYQSDNSTSNSELFTYDTMLKTIERQNEFIQNMKAILTAYETVIFVNLQDYSFKVLTGTPEVKLVANKQKNILEVVRMFGEYQVKPEHRTFFYSFLNPLTVSDRLTGQRFITAEYDTTNLGWVHARLIPVEYDNQGNLLSLIFTTECVEAEHKELEILRYTSETDELTELPNRSTGQKLTGELIEKGEPFVFVLFDCDRFKDINDKLSHLVGDKVLISIANTLRKVFANQLVFRLGGDEFVAVISGDMAKLIIEQGKDIMMSAEASHYPIFEALHNTISNINIPELSRTPLTISGGAVIYRGGVTTFNDIYRKSDRALQLSKFQRTGIVTIVNL